MKKRKLFIIAIIVFIIATAISVKLLFSSDKILVNFEIIKVDNNYSEYNVEFTKVKAAHHYVIQVHNSNNRKVFELSTTKEKNTINLTNLINNEEYSLIVLAYDEVGDYRPCEKEYRFKWSEPSFDDESSLILNNEDYKLSILGYLKNKDYHLIIKDGKNKIIDEILKNNEYIINKDLYINQEKELTALIMSEDKIVDELHLFNNMNPVSDVVISKPVSASIISYNDITLSYTGGDNAETYEIKIYEGKNLIKTTKTKKQNVVLSKKLFKVASTYLIEVTAKYGDYIKAASVTFTMSEQEQLSPVYLSNNWKYVKKGTKLKLSNKDENAKIYYTLDGTSPDSNGKLYSEPIEINDNVTLKTVAMADNKVSSVISTYDINVGVKDKLKVYLSPSNQHGNLGVKSVGYTNEMDEMNDLSNYIEERLKAHGVIVYRNSPAGNINQWNLDSIYYGVDFKIAIHSNASDAHTNYGIETWIDTENSNTYSIANQIQNGLMSIYPYASLEGANRGVKYAAGALGEANDLYAPFQLLVEVAHHDYEDDAKWIMENKKLIGYNIADSILRYYQIIE